LSARNREEAVAAMLRRAGRCVSLLRAIERTRNGDAASINKLAASPFFVLSVSQAGFLREHSVKEVRELAVKVLGEGSTESRQAVIERFAGVLTMKGDAQAGRVTFLRRCASCHRADGEGFAVGPDLASVKTAGREKLLTNILDPGREVTPNHQAILVETKDGVSEMGVVVRDDASGITLRQAHGREVAIDRARVKRARMLKESLMPDGLEDGLEVRDLGDLLEFIEKL
jgi:putative heme-binding domain-containing protein